MTFKDIIIRRPYTFGITLVVVFLACGALIFSLPSQAQVKSSVQLAIERGKHTAIADVETTVRRLSLVELDLVLLALSITDPNLSVMRIDPAGEAIVFTSSVSEKDSNTAKRAQQLLIDKILQNDAAEVARIRGEKEEHLILTQQALRNLEKDRDSVMRDLTELADSHRRMTNIGANNDNSQEAEAPPKFIDSERSDAARAGVREESADREVTLLLTHTQRMNFGLILADTNEKIVRHQKQLTDIRYSLAAIEPARVLQPPTVFPGRGQPSRRGLLLVTALFAALMVAFLAALTRERLAH
jgi:hypothetical protein